MALDLFNYGKAGSGVKKGAPKKKSFFLFWEIFGNKFWKFFQVNLIYVLFCLPIVTFGPATAAMTQIMRKFVIGEPIFVWDEFLTAFKANFKKSFVIGIVDLALIAGFFFAVNFYLSPFMTDGSITDIFGGLGTENMLIFGACIVIGFYVFMMHFYIYPQIVALKLNMAQIINNSLRLMIGGLFRNLAGLFACILIVFLMVMGFPYTVIALPLLPFAWMCFIATFCAYPVIQKYIIDPYYEARGEKNPEYARYETAEDDENVVFEDKGGSEAPVELSTGNDKKKKPSAERVQVKPKGKVIK